MYALLPRKLASGVLVPLIGFTSAVVFCLLDVLDVTMCFFFRILDGFLEGEGESSSCYCWGAQPRREAEGDGESELSETLYVRANVLRDLLMVGRTTGVEKRGVWAGKGNRWSDCRCESCISWVGDGAGAGADFRLHVFVREPGGEGNAASEVLRQLATRRVWPPLLFGSAFMSWYEHLGRCVCFFFCRNHRFWEWLIKLLIRQREVHFSIADLTCHTHHSAWHTMHNVICGGAKLLDRYLEALSAVGVKIHVVQGTNDQVVPVECSYRMKAKAAEIELELVPNADHNSVLLDRAEELTDKLERLWDSCSQVIRE